MSLKAQPHFLERASKWHQPNADTVVAQFKNAKDWGAAKKALRMKTTLDGERDTAIDTGKGMIYPEHNAANEYIIRFRGEMNKEALVNFAAKRENADLIQRFCNMKISGAEAAHDLRHYREDKALGLDEKANEATVPSPTKPIPEQLPLFTDRLSPAASAVARVQSGRNNNGKTHRR